MDNADPAPAEDTILMNLASNFMASKVDDDGVELNNPVNQAEHSMVLQVDDIDEDLNNEDPEDDAIDVEAVEERSSSPSTPIDRKTMIMELHFSKHPSKHGGHVYRHAIAASCFSFYIFLVYGASFGSLGAALPYLYSVIDATHDELTWIFTARGVGFLGGTIIAAVLLEGFYGIDYTPYSGRTVRGILWN